MIVNGVNRPWINWSLLERHDIHEIIRQESLDELEKKLFSLLSNNQLRQFIILAPVGPQKGRFRGSLREVDYERLENIDKESIMILTRNFSLGEQYIKSYNFTTSPEDFSKDELTKCKYFLKEIDAPDPFSAIELFSSEIQTLQRVIDISKIPVKREDIHYRKRNLGGVFKSVFIGRYF
jgi:hypothetical protein